MSYITVDSLRSYLGNTTSTDDALLQGCIQRAQGAIDTYCRRTFEAAAGTLYYHQHEALIRGQVLFLDADVYSVTTLVNGNGATITQGTNWTNQYFLEPRRDGPPYSMIRLGYSYPWVFNVDQPITIAGTIGYSLDAPADVQQATLRLASYYYRMRDAAVYDVTADPALGAMTINKGFPADVKQILEPYRKTFD